MNYGKWSGCLRGRVVRTETRNFDSVPVSVKYADKNGLEDTFFEANSGVVGKRNTSLRTAWSTGFKSL